MKVLRISQWLPPLLLACVGCTGLIGSSEEETPRNGGADSELPSIPPGGEPGGSYVVPTTVLDSGRVVLRRLNRTEYDNTMRDLLGSTLNLARKTPFAADDVVDYFNTNGEALVMSLLLTEQMDQAASTLIEELMGRTASDPWRNRILTCEPSASTFDRCATEVLNGFMKNAYRRPVTADEVQARVDLGRSVLQSSGDPTVALSAALKSVLLSPHVLYRVELGDPESPVATPLSDYELASRLSYFLWASMPDQELFDAAAAGQLSAAGPELTAQVERMLADDKAEGLIESFAGQWLSTRDAPSFVAEAALFPDYDDELRLSLAQETNLFFKALIDERQPLTTLLRSDFTFVNDRLARHYGLPPVGDGFQRVSLRGSPRIGILSHASVLAVTSHPNRTSVVKRAEWVLERLLCDPPPPPPAMIPPIKEELPPGLTLRQTLEAHRANPACAGCHKIMDPIGFALENFDATGAFRTMDNGAPVDASGQLADGTPLAGHEDLAAAIANDADYAICVAKHLLTFAVGRSFSAEEAKAYAAGIGVTMKDATWPEFIHAIVQSEAFRTRRGEAQ
ncbi:DUF1592 domain-containing protein [Sorangium sp. So ce136]|uniref:DUF1592 domain-containing protein n=1 Tax=Sorangium sp. So ce136 TaxID=3133284 RepID=UPI003F06D9AA